MGSPCAAEIWNGVFVCSFCSTWLQVISNWLKEDVVSLTFKESLLTRDLPHGMNRQPTKFARRSLNRAPPRVTEEWSPVADLFVFPSPFLSFQPQGLSENPLPLPLLSKILRRGCSVRKVQFFPQTTTLPILNWERLFHCFSSKGFFCWIYRSKLLQTPTWEGILIHLACPGKNVPNIWAWGEMSLSSGH